MSRFSPKKCMFRFSCHFPKVVHLSYTCSRTFGSYATTSCSNATSDRDGWWSVRPRLQIGGPIPAKVSRHLVVRFFFLRTCSRNLLLFSPNRTWDLSSLNNYNTAPRGWKHDLDYYRPVTFNSPKVQGSAYYSDFWERRVLRFSLCWANDRKKCRSEGEPRDNSINRMSQWAKKERSWRREKEWSFGFFKHCRQQKETLH